nr:hypothetical protein [uncultured Rhodopila sp.]
MDTYDPLIPPNPKTWLALDEAERIVMIEDYHEAQDIEIPGADLHAIIHAIIENQVAEGDALPVREKLRQLMAQGIDRHEAIHAIGSVLIKHIAAITQGKTTTDDPNIPYFRALKRLNAKKWLRSG